MVIRRDGYSLKYFPNSFFDDLFINPRMIRDDEVFLAKYLKKGDTYIDVGANIGTTSLRAAVLVGENGRVFAIEPHPVTYAQLITNISLNPHIRSRISPLCLAMGVTKGELHMTDMLANDANYVTDKGSIPVKVETLDALFGEESKIDLLKIDVEGFEKFVLEGGVDTLKKTHQIYFEGYEKQYERSGYSFTDIRALLHQAGFSVYLTIAKDKDIVLEALPLGYLPKSVENFLATRD